MFKKILVVCIGNICRSPTAEALLASRLKDKGFTISSAGLGALVGKPMDAQALAVFVEKSNESPIHVAKQLDAQMIRDAELILVMEQNHIDGVLRISPEARGKVFILGKWLNNKDIPDPYRMSDEMFQHTYVLIEEAVNAWVKKLL